MNLGVFFSSGDLGDVGRHVVAAALEYPQRLVAKVRVFSDHVESSDEQTWQQNSDSITIEKTAVLGENRDSRANTSKKVLGKIDGTYIVSEKGSNTKQNKENRIEVVHINFACGPTLEQMEGIDTIITCLGHRKPFFEETVAHEGMQHIVAAMLAAQISRIVMLSSVGVGDDWPPLEWHAEGSRLQGFFRTICWKQYQDLCGAELTVREAAQNHLQYVIVRSVLLDDSPAIGGWYVQQKKYQDHPAIYISKKDCAKYLVTAALQPLTNTTVVVGGEIPVKLEKESQFIA